LRLRHPLVWKEMTPEQKRIALANALSLDPKVLDRAFKLARKNEPTG
jgi:predicted ABC-type transport system involved in lysophospholipase L1 biosynthesis ATPase subunit